MSMSKSNHRVAAVAAGAAILLSLGSFGAVAAGMITGKDIKDGSIRQVDIGRNAVGAGEIEAGAVRLSDLSDGAERGLQGERGPKGEQGPKGDKGDKGDKGEAGPPGESHDINAVWTANPSSRLEGYTVVLEGGNTSVETKNLGVTVEAGDIISFEYTLLDGATCGAGGPRMFVKVGDTYENTFDATTNCGTDGKIVYALTNGGTITEAGLVHDNGSGGTVYVTDVLVDGMPVYFG
jgi:hypothetical protein